MNLYDFKTEIKADSMVLQSLKQEINEKYVIYSNDLIEMLDDDFFDKRMTEDEFFCDKLRDARVPPMVFPLKFDKDEDEILINELMANRILLYRLNESIRYNKMIFNSRLYKDKFEDAE